MPFAVLWSIHHMEYREAQADFKWFSTLGFPDVKNVPFVQTPGEPGFLVSSNVDQITILTLWLEARTFSNNTALPNSKSTDFAVTDLKKHANAFLEELRDPSKNSCNCGPPSERQLFALAWACWRNGLDSEALELRREAEHTGEESVWDNLRGNVLEKAAQAGQKLLKKWKESKTRPSLQARMEKDLAETIMACAIMHFEDRSYTRPDLLREIEDVIRHYSQPSNIVAKAGQLAKTLKAMIEEEKTHIAPADLTQLPQEQQIAELIFRLREQSHRKTTNDPSQQLLALGIDAVPQLIIAADSEKLTRFAANSQRVLTVGDFAADILAQISGRPSIQSNTYRRKAAEAWWKEFQEKGEKQVLVDGVIQGRSDAPTQAMLLARKYPEELGAALLQGIAAAKSISIRTNLIRLLNQVKSPAAASFVSQEAIKGTNTASKITAAYAWRGIDRDQAIKAMVQEWQRLNTTKPRRGEIESVGEFLASTDSSDTVSALSSNLVLTVADHGKLVQMVGDTNSWASRKATYERSSPETLQAIEAFLITALGDKSNYSQILYTRSGKRAHFLRICDLAACYLAERWPVRYTFDITGSVEQRDKQIRKILEQWKKDHELP